MATEWSGMRGTQELEAADPDVDPGSTTQKLCDLKQVTLLLWTSIVLFQQGKRNSATLTGLWWDLTLPI